LKSEIIKNIKNKFFEISRHTWFSGGRPLNVQQMLYVAISLEQFISKLKIDERD
jgi:hypothetical protein